jgi:hypothetical protein
VGEDISGQKVQLQVREFISHRTRGVSSGQRVHPQARSSSVQRVHPQFRVLHQVIEFILLSPEIHPHVRGYVLRQDLLQFRELVHPQFRVYIIKS